MRFKQLLKAIFGYTAMPAPEPRPAFDQQAYVAKHLAEIAEAAVQFQQRYGSDFNAFFYRPNASRFIAQEVAPLVYPSPDERHWEKYGRFLDNSHWSVRNVFNFPGPFYTGESDSCGTGEYEAPANTLNDHHYCEFVFRQPQNFEELLCVLSAAAVETFDSYSCDGNDRWTYTLCREWWCGKAELIRCLGSSAFRENNEGRGGFTSTTSTAQPKPTCANTATSWKTAATPLLPTLYRRSSQ